MNWTRLGKQENVLSEPATRAENRLKAIKKAAKQLKKSVEESLRTTSGGGKKQETLETRKRKSAEFVLGDSVASSVNFLNEEKPCWPVKDDQSPLNTIFERYANFEKTIGFMLAENEREVETFWCSNTPIANLLQNEMPAVAAEKKKLQEICNRRKKFASDLEKEHKKLESMQGATDSSDTLDSSTNSDVDPDVVLQQRQKRDAMARELESIERDLALENDKMTSKLLSLAARENHYASSVVELLRIKMRFFQKASEMAVLQLQETERLLQETHLRPVFGEAIEDHLKSTGREIAIPIGISVSLLRKSGLNDEGLFRLAPSQIKLTKLKAHIDSNLPLGRVLADGDVHLYSGLLKSYLRSLPVPLLGSNYQRWIIASLNERARGMVSEFRSILRQEVTEKVRKNIQYLFKFLLELSGKSEETKMTVHNIAIVLGPNLLWQEGQQEGGGSPSTNMSDEQGNLERIIVIVSNLIENYDVIFDEDFKWEEIKEDDGLEEEIEQAKLELEKESLAAQESAAAASSSHGLTTHNNNSPFGTFFSTSNRHSLTPGSPTLLSEHQRASPGYKRRFEQNILNKIWTN